MRKLKTMAVLAISLVVLGLAGAADRADAYQGPRDCYSAHGFDPITLKCNQGLDATTTPQVWTMDYPHTTPHFLAYRFTFDGAQWLGQTQGCEEVLNRNGLHLRLRWCAGEPLNVRYVVDSGTKHVRLDWTIYDN
jgi:hypothetical protein